MSLPWVPERLEPIASAKSQNSWRLHRSGSRKVISTTGSVFSAALTRLSAAAAASRSPALVALEKRRNLP